MASVCAFVYLFLIGTVLESFKLYVGNTGDWIAYVSTGVLIAAACFFICREYPRSVWYVPLICNFTGILAAVIEPAFWGTSMWVMFLIGWILTIFASFIGAWMGRETGAPANH